MSKSLAIIGSRTFNSYSLLEDKFNLYFREAEELYTVDTVVSGGAAGADALAGQLAVDYGFKYIEFKPDYAKHGKIAPLVRNEEIIKNCDCVLAFWDSISRGTQNALNWAKKYKKDTIIIYF